MVEDRLMINKRKAERRIVDMGVRMLVKGEAFQCRACEISPIGIRLENALDYTANGEVVEIEVPLVEGQLTTQVSARPVWCRSGFEAFEFVETSFAQQAMLERLFGNF
jgi:hypothetical protein